MSKEEIARAVQLAVQDEITKYSYKIGSYTIKALEVKETFEKTTNGLLAFECGSSLGKTAYSAAADFSKGDKLCTGLCLVATVCEGVAFTTRFVQIPYGQKIYIFAKSTSVGLMKFRNLCRASDGTIVGC